MTRDRVIVAAGQTTEFSVKLEVGNQGDSIRIQVRYSF
jgi:hypothetical protein